MSSDPIVEEIRKARTEVFARFEGDIHGFFEYLRERERESNEPIVTLAPNAPEVVIAPQASR